jgi:hypothetical protein
LQRLSQILDSIAIFGGCGKNPKAPNSGLLETISQVLLVPVSIGTAICFGLRLAHLTGDGSAAILRSHAPKQPRDVTLHRQPLGKSLLMAEDCYRSLPEDSNAQTICNKTRVPVPQARAAGSPHRVSTL